VQDIGLQELDRSLDTGGTIDIRIHKRLTQTDGFHTESQELQDIGTISHTAIGIDLSLFEHLWRRVVNSQRYCQRRRTAVQMSAAMIGEDNASDTFAGGDLGVGYACDPFE